MGSNHIFYFLFFRRRLCLRLCHLTSLVNIVYRSIMFPKLAFYHFPSTVRDLTCVAADIQLARINLQEEITKIMETSTSQPSFESTNETSLIQVTLPRNQGLLYAKVDPEDHEKVVNVAQDWFVNSNGYAYTIKRTRNEKLKYIFLHKLISGGVSKHINGDRLDNRKANLLLTRQTPAET